MELELQVKKGFLFGANLWVCESDSPGAQSQERCLTFSTTLKTDITQNMPCLHSLSIIWHTQPRLFLLRHSRPSESESWLKMVHNSGGRLRMMMKVMMNVTTRTQGCVCLDGRWRSSGSYAIQNTHGETLWNVLDMVTERKKHLLIRRYLCGRHPWQQPGQN